MTSSQSDVYDLCIVGAGLIGSAAARYASQTPGLRVCLLGPEEPKDRQTAKVWGAYYDEARITRSTDVTSFWAQVARRSIQRYRQLERETGIHFYDEVGALECGPSQCEHMQSTAASAMEVNAQTLSSDELASNFPYLYANPHNVGILESHNAGIINPRAIRKAELKLAVTQGCNIIDDIASQVYKVKQKSDGSVMLEIRTAWGKVVLARKILLTTGAFTQFFGLLQRGQIPNVSLDPISVILAEVSENDRQRLKLMPCISCKLPPVEDTSSPLWLYVLPPVFYPDEGKWYIKLGACVDETPRPLSTMDQLRKHYCGQVPENDKALLRYALRKLLPDVHPISVKFDTCVVTTTPNKHPYIDMVTPQIGVALGGNGWAAKSCDELGRVAATLVTTGEWEGPPGTRDKCRFQAQVGTVKL